MENSFEIKCSKNFGRVINFENFEYVDRKNRIVKFKVTVKDVDFNVLGWVIYTEIEGLIELFKFISINWKGWKGSKSWRSYKKELYIRTTCDSLGHIKLVIKLRNRNHQKFWYIRLAIFIEAGQIDKLLNQLQKFFQVTA